MIKLTHLKTAWQGTKMAWSGLRLVRDPSKLGEVFAIADAIEGVGQDVLTRMAVAFRQDPQGAEALDTRRRLSLPSRAALAAMPVGSVGRAFADYLDRNGIDPSALPSRPSSDDASFVRAHLYETHDLWHVVTGFETDVAGELGLQAFYMAQTEARLAPLLLALGMINTAGQAFDERHQRLDAITRGWMLGKRARPLFGLDWASRWEQPLTSLRAELALSLDDVDQAVAAPVTTSAWVS